MSIRVLVVEHEATAGAGLIAQRISAHGFDMVVCGPDAGLVVPRGPQGFDGVIVLGGSMGPTDDDRAPWLPATRSLIRECIDGETPLLGVCLGAQLMATALGGKVGPLNSPEVGTGTIELTCDGRTDPLLATVPTDAPTLHWHWLHTSQLPPQATVLASSRMSPVQAFRVGSHAWGLQFHLEAVRPTARTWARDMSDQLRADGLDPERLAAAWESHASEAEETWAGVVDTWLHTVTGSHSARHPDESRGSAGA